MKTAVFIVLLALAALAPVEARIFSRQPAAGDDIPAFLEALGGRTAYRAPVRINGAEADLMVIGLDDPHDARAAEIRAALRLDRPAASGGDAFYRIVAGDRVTRLLLFRPGMGAQTLAVLIEQTAAEYRKGRAAAGNHRVSPLPLYPGSRPGLHAENEDTGLSFATLTAAAAPEQVAAFYHTSLAAAGWLPMFPDADPAGSCLFLRENALCYVLVSAAPEESAGSHITLLHKPFKNPKP